MRNYNYLASRMLGTPLLIERGKLDAILTALSPRLGLEMPESRAATVIADNRRRKPYAVTDDGIAIISIVGPLVKRQSGSFLSGGPTTYTQIENEFMDAAQDPDISGILLEVDSPGGESSGAFELSDLIYSQRGTKPIGCAVDGDAFSAAYAIGSAADWMCLTKSGGVGSVGVWMLHVDRSAQNVEEGLRPTYIYAGARKIDGNPDGPLTPEALAVFQGEVNRIYGMFVDCVARNRNMSADAVRSTEAGLFFGEDATTTGFADQMGTFDQALQRICEDVSQVSSVAQAATKPPKGSNSMKTKDEAEPQAAPAGTAAKAPDFQLAVRIVEQCAVAGLSARAALAHLTKPGITIEAVNQELVKDRAAASGPEIASQILPDAGTHTEARPSQSPVVKACEAIAQNAKGGK